MRRSIARLLACSLVSCALGIAPGDSAPLAQAADDKAAQRPPLPNLPAPPDVAAAPADAQKTPSGLASKVIQKGTGTVHPKATDKVEVHYAGWMTNGVLFDTSKKRNTTAKFPLNMVIKGWTEGVQLMVVGEKRRFWIPADLAYGDTPRRPGGPHGTLVFDIELVSINPPE